ncbi:hypothetical protein EC973_002858 [Apophysomyces ossiformis]|uniref:F-box domain-containing protein n=1 Tax=Apophysomyces ossiformis TaxID=679940 RepID=A0A8H7EMC5_9FUNG|nr:hypothetical protein EC973_002858 [Apophysomyces ossiformis]
MVLTRRQKRALEAEEAKKNGKEDKMDVDTVEHTLTNQKTPRPPAKRQKTTTTKKMTTNTSKKKPSVAEKKQNTYTIIRTSDVYLPTEVWRMIFSYLRPSQLAILASVCRNLNNMVINLSLWKTICEKGNLGVPKRKYRNYFALAAGFHSCICEQCYRKCRLSGSSAALPIMIESEHRQIRMCLPCRRDYYEIHPEPLPSDETESNNGESSNSDNNNSSSNISDTTTTTATTTETDNGNADAENSQQAQPQAQTQTPGRRRRRERVTKSAAMAEFKLTEGQLSEIPCTLHRNPYYRSAAPMRLYDMDDLIVLSRRVHGGDVGVKEALEASSTRSRKTMESRERNQEIRREKLVAKLQEHGMEMSESQVLCNNYIRSNAGSPDSIVEEIRKQRELQRRRDERRRLLREKLAAAGMNEAEDQWACDSYVLYESGTPESIITKIAEKRELNARTEERRQRITSALNAVGLNLRADSSLCSQYINQGKGNLEEIVTIMMEMDWYFRCTNYASARYIEVEYDDYDDWYDSEESDWSDWGYFRGPRRMVDSDHGKRVALTGWVKARLASGNLQPVSEDHDTPERPPRSLWPEIARKSIALLVGVAADRLVAEADKSLGSEILRTDPEQFTLDEPTIIRLLDQSSPTRHERYSFHPPPPPSPPADQVQGASSDSSEKNQRTSFSEFLRQQLGGNRFMDIFSQAKRRIYDNQARKFVIDHNAVGTRPVRLENWLQQGRMRRPEWKEATRQFIQNEVPQMEAELGIHRQVLTKLVNSTSNTLLQTF